MHKHQTIFALSTVYGKSGVAVFRISGQDITPIKQFINQIPEHKCLAKTKFKYQNKTIDECIVLNFNAPYSFTGENVIEIQTHGSKYIIKKITEALSTVFRIAQPGEFIQRGYQNQKLTLMDVEATLNLINAEYEYDHQLVQATKNFQKYIETLKSKIINIIAQLESNIDFPEDVNFVQINNTLKELNTEVENAISSFEVTKNIKKKITIAIIGKPNVGKSSLINAISQQETSIVSPYAGTTRDAVSVEIELDNIPIKIIDTAGIRKLKAQNTENEIEKMGIAKSIQIAKESEIIMHVFDNYDEAKCEPQKDKTIVILNKIDQHQSKINNKNIISISAKNQIGIQLLLDTLRNKMLTKYKEINNMHGICITHNRHLQLMQIINHHIIEIINSKNIISMQPEITTYILNKILHHICEIHGSTCTNETILNQIFTQFCIGK